MGVGKVIGYVTMCVGSVVMYTFLDWKVWMGVILFVMGNAIIDRVYVTEKFVRKG